MPENIDDVCDFIVSRANAAGESLSVLKLQKLLYYAQAWHLAFGNGRLFEGDFKAWVHGPVNLQIYHRFRDDKSLYSIVCEDEVRSDFSEANLSEAARQHINVVMESYMPFTGTQLEEMTHKEEPWVEAREGLADHERCSTPISEETMQTYYRSRLQ